MNVVRPLTKPHTGPCFGDKELSPFILGLCSLALVSRVRNAKLPGYLDNDLITIVMAVAMVSAVRMMMHNYPCLLERLVIVALATSLGFSLLSRVGYGELLGRAVWPIELVLWA